MSIERELIRLFTNEEDWQAFCKVLVRDLSRAFIYRSGLTQSLKMIGWRGEDFARKVEVWEECSCKTDIN